MRLLEMMTGPWAILPETLLELQSIYATYLKGEKIDIAAVETRLGRPLVAEQQRYELREGGVAVLSATGVMAPKANLFMQVSGGISTQMLARQFDSMAADPRVKAVIFAPDSPGGNVLGVPAAVRALRSLAAAKPTVTVVEGVMASAMYWVGSAANQVHIEGETDMAGSLGVVQRVSWEPAEPNARTLVRGKYKRASINGQPPSAEYLAQAEQQLDYLYSLLVDSVAQHRGTTSDLVLERMADGRVFIGQQAIDAGLVDGVSTVDAMVEKLATNPKPYAARRKAVFSGPRKGAAPGARATQPPALPAARTEGEQTMYEAARVDVNKPLEEQIEPVRAYAARNGFDLFKACKVLGFGLTPEESADYAAARRAAQLKKQGQPLTTLTREEQAAAARGHAAMHDMSFVEALQALGVEH
jgi:ClpP class serine protease